MDHHLVWQWPPLMLTKCPISFPQLHSIFTISCFFHFCLCEVNLHTYLTIWLSSCPVGIFLRSSPLIAKISILSKVSHLKMAKSKINSYHIRRVWRRSWSAWAYAHSRSCFTLASSRIRSCSRRYSSLASWRALMVSMICCKVGASLLSDLNNPCLVFLISQNAQSQMWMGSSFIESHSGRQMFSSIGLGWIEWASSTSDLSPIGAPRYCSTGTMGALPVDHTPTIKSVRAFKL